jgi:SsrA-binding protein
MYLSIYFSSTIRYNTTVMKHKPTTAKKIQNRRARHDYELDDSLLVGLVLTGKETKSLRRGRGNLRGAYVTVKDDQLWLINATITGDVAMPIEESDQTRARKLLAKKKQIAELIAQKQQGRTIVPIELLTQGRYIKLRIAAGKGKKHYDKRETIKKRDQERELLHRLKQQHT